MFFAYVAAKGTGQDHSVQLVYAPTGHQQLGASIKGGFGQLHSADVNLGDEDLLSCAGLVGGGQNEFAYLPGGAEIG